MVEQSASDRALDRHVATLPDGVTALRVPGRPDPRRRAPQPRWRTLIHPAGIATILATATVPALGIIIIWLALSR